MKVFETPRIPAMSEYRHLPQPRPNRPRLTCSLPIRVSPWHTRTGTSFRGLRRVCFHMDVPAEEYHELPDSVSCSGLKHLLRSRLDSPGVPGRAGRRQAERGVPPLTVPFLNRNASIMNYTVFSGTSRRPRSTMPSCVGESRQGYSERTGMDSSSSHGPCHPWRTRNSHCGKHCKQRSAKCLSSGRMEKRRVSSAAFASMLCAPTLPTSTSKPPRTPVRNSSSNKPCDSITIYRQPCTTEAAYRFSRGSSALHLRGRRDKMPRTVCGC